MSTDFQPQVAFLCNKPAMHLAAGRKWIKDEATDCIRDPVQILKYCRQMYPSENITNIMEGKRVAIPNWCRRNTRECLNHGTHKVIPYRCLVGPFQTDSLLVPEHCTFDHLYDPKKCLNERDWADLAISACTQNGKIRQSSAMLMPCDTDKFEGVEFVCCPRQGKPKSFVPFDSNQQKKQPTQGDAELRVRPKMSGREDILPEPEREGSLEGEGPLHEVDLDSYHKYLINGLSRSISEHDQYEMARKTERKLQREKMAQVMKRWSQELEKLSKLRPDHPKEAEDKAKRVGQKYNSMYKAMREVGAMERRQLEEIHESRLAEKFMEEKQAAMSSFLNTLQIDKMESYQPNLVLKRLQHLIRIEERDKMHTVNHFFNLKQKQPQRAADLVSTYQKHLRLIDARITHAVQMLDTITDRAARDTVKSNIQNFLTASYDALDQKAKKLQEEKVPDEPMMKLEPALKSGPSSSSPPPSPTTTSSTDQEPLIRYDAKEIPGGLEFELEEDDGDDLDLDSAQEDLDDEDDSTYDYEDETEDEKDSDEEIIDDSDHKEPVVQQKIDNGGLMGEAGFKIDNGGVVVPLKARPETSTDKKHENEHSSFVDDVREIVDELEDGAKKRKEKRSKMDFHYLVVISIGALVILLLATVGLFWNARRLRRSRMLAYTEMEQQMTPEEYHVYKMQQHGYVNPTWEFLEKKEVIT